jgi:hypothetical protein
VLDELAADASVRFSPGERQQVGRWSIVQLADFGFLHKT